MAIEQSRVTPTRYTFKCDPDGESWIDILPLSGRMDEIRGNLLKAQEFVFEGDRVIHRVNVNPRALEREEVYLSFGGAHIVIRTPDGDVNLFQDDNMDRATFFEAFDQVPGQAKIEWRDAVRRQIPEWAFPF